MMQNRLQKEKEEIKQQRESGETDSKEQGAQMYWKAVVNREIDKIYTKATYLSKYDENSILGDTEVSSSSLDAKYILFYIYEEDENQFGFTYFDTTTLKFYLGQFKDDSLKSKFRTLITSTRPLEVVWSSKHRNSAMTKMLINSPILPSFSYIHHTDIVDLRHSEMLIENYLKSEKYGLPDWIQEMIEDYNDSKLAITSLGNAILYLEQMMMAKTTVPFGQFYKHDDQTSEQLKHMKSMVIDAQALENLDILEVQGKNHRVTKGSLFEYLDRTRTQFGRRLLK